MICSWCGKPRRGVIFPVDGFVCHTCQDSGQRQWVRQVDDAARGVLRRDQDGVLWPYGPNIEMESRVALLDWAKFHDVKMPKKRTVCAHGLHWLSKGRCAHQRCTKNGLPAFFDHTTLWSSRSTNKPALVFNQPYGEVTQAEAVEFASAYEGLTAYVGNDGWYGYTTTAVYIWNEGNR